MKQSDLNLHIHTLNLKLRDERQRQGITQKELAKRCKIHVTTLIRIENNQIEARIGTYLMIANELNLNLQVYGK